MEGKKARHWWNGLSRFRKPSEVSLCLPQLRYFFAHLALTTYVKYVTAGRHMSYYSGKAPFQKAADYVNYPVLQNLQFLKHHY